MACLRHCISVTSDDILAKYRKPAAANKSTTDNMAAAGPTVVGPAAVTADAVLTKSKDKVDSDEMPLPPPSSTYDSNNLEICQAFLDAKKKLRLILSSVDLQVAFSLPLGSHFAMHMTIG